MPLVQCPECQKDVSSEALSCPQCAFPYPGKKERVNGKGSEALRNCGDCGNFISKQAKVCPHCGSPTSRDQVSSDQGNGERTSLEIEQETWLCPHCGVPFTRRIKGAKGKSGQVRPQQLLPSPPGQLVEKDDNGARLAEARQELMDAYRPKKEKRKSPLWGESPSIREEEPQYPRPRRKWGFFIFVIVSVLLVALASFAFLNLKGLNPLEALVYWQM